MKNLLLIAVMALTISCGAQRSAYKNMYEKDGKIGIGTNTPDELLTVKGKIHTQEVLVDLEGAVAPDYVFESYFEGASTSKPEYQRPSLTELASYIKSNGHLPGIPSAQSMEESGISLKVFNLLLLEKVEELTLYTLDQQKEIENLKLMMEKLTVHSN
jgi:hypothetical protein